MKKLAVIGSGIAGMSAAYFLKDEYDITVFEKNDYVGGHTNTIDVHDGIKECPMDTGFMVFNEKTYPNLLKLFKKLDVPYENTDMSFSVRNVNIDLEYNGTNLDGLFSQRKNVLNLKFLKMIKDILVFNGDAIKMLENPLLEKLTIGEYIKTLGLGDYFFTNFLIPMSSAVWSTPIDKIKNFPAKSLVRFFHNHGFVGVNTQLQWKTVSGGSREYRKRIIKAYEDRIKVDSGVSRIVLHDKNVEIFTKDKAELFDKVIVATHADEALGMLANPTEKQKNILSKFSYQENIAIVHSDESVMPRMKKNWSSWNFIMEKGEAYTVYYMNRLQGVSREKSFFVNINGEEFIEKDKVIKRLVYHHPVFDTAAVLAQKRIDEMNEHPLIHFTGSYYRYGFHEDALLSSVNLCSRILGREVLL